MAATTTGKVVRFGRRSADLARLAKLQRWLAVFVVLILLDHFAIFGQDLFFPVGVAVTNAFFIYNAVAWIAFLVINLAAAILTIIIGRVSGQDLATIVLIAVVVAFVPVCGFFALLMVNQRVVGLFNGHGIAVGLLGASRQDLNKLKIGFCVGCGYDLRNLPAGPCPECGLVFRPVPAPQPSTFSNHTGRARHRGCRCHNKNNRGAEPRGFEILTRD